MKKIHQGVARDSLDTLTATKQSKATFPSRSKGHAVTINQILLRRESERVIFFFAEKIILTMIISDSRCSDRACRSLKTEFT